MFSQTHSLSLCLDTSAEFGLIFFNVFFKSCGSKLLQRGRDVGEGLLAKMNAGEMIYFKEQRWFKSPSLKSLNCAVC